MLTCPGIKVKGFNAVNSFLIIIKFEPNPSSVLTDTPIDLPQKTRFLPGYNNIIFNDQRFDLSPQYQNMNDLLNKYSDYFDNIKKNIEDLQNQLKNNLNPDTNNYTCTCPIDDMNLDDLINQIQNGESPDFMTIETINKDDPDTYDPSKNLVTYCDETDQLGLANQINIPDIEQGAFNTPAAPNDFKCLFNDDKLKNVASYVEDNLLNPDNNFLNDMNDLVNDDDLKNLADNLKDYLDNNGVSGDLVNQIQAPLPDTIPTEDILRTKYNIKFQLGIPLVVLDCKNQIYLQIINKKLQVTNLIDFSGKYLEIDQEIDLTSPCYVGFYTNGYIHRLYYYSSSEGVLHTDEITIKKNLTISYIGIDDLFKKHYCGLIYDIQILLFQNASFEHYLTQTFQFDVPAGALYYYDWHKTRIKYNLVFPLPDLKPPVKMYSQGGLTHYMLHTEKDPYHFMELGYLTQFFCWRKLTKSDFSIAFWFNKLEYQNGANENDYRCLIYDEIHNYGVYYNDYEKKFKIDINNSIHYFDFIIEDNLWYFCNFKYSKEEHKLYLNIRNINSDHFDDFTEFTIDFDESFNFGPFHLSSMLAKKTGSIFNNYFNCKFGTLALFDNKRETAEEYTQFFEEKQVIIGLKL